MGFFDGFPWSDKQSLNLDWLLCQMKTLKDELNSFMAVRQKPFVFLTFFIILYKISVDKPCQLIYNTKATVRGVLCFLT